MDFAWRTHINATFKSTFYCSIATNGTDGVWVNPVYFAYDDKFSLYFVSLPISRHMKNIGEGATIAVAIYATDQPPGGDVRGIQLRGYAELLKDDQVPAAHKIYYARQGASEALGGIPDVEAHIGIAAVWKFVKVTPQEMYYFDTRFFDEVKEGRQLVPLESLKDNH
jgi:uncharacterized protein YhbP (UPF0306 family)